jgi:hypothetical protein
MHVEFVIPFAEVGVDRFLYIGEEVETAVHPITLSIVVAGIMWPCHSAVRECGFFLCLARPRMQTRKLVQAFVESGNLVCDKRKSQNSTEFVLVFCSDEIVIPCRECKNAFRNVENSQDRSEVSYVFMSSL